MLNIRTYKRLGKVKRKNYKQQTDVVQFSRINNN